MRLKKFLMFEIERLSNKQYIAIMLFFLLLSGYFLQCGIGRYKRIMEEKSNFKAHESTKIDRIVYIPQYGFYGIRILFVPSPFIAFFDAGPVPDYMTAFIDSSERLKIYQPLKGRNAFAGFTSLFVNFAGFILLFGTLSASLYGFTAYNDHNWQQFLESIIGSRTKLFLFLAASRAVLPALFCLAAALLSIVLFVLNGLEVEFINILIYFFGTYLMLLSFLFIGLITGGIKSRFKGGGVLVTAWLFLAFLFPVVTCQWTYSRASSIESPYKMESEKQKLFMDYERNSNRKEGKFAESKRGTEIEKQLFLTFWHNGFREAMTYEERTLNQVKDKSFFFQTLAALCPSSFFLSLSNEMSSGGFSGLVEFQQYCQIMKKDFFWYMAELYIFSSRQEFEPFIKGNENIFQSESRLPVNFNFGIAVTVLWLVILPALSWFSFNRMLDRRPEGKKIPETGQDRKLLPDDFKKDKTTIVFTLNLQRISQLLAKLKSEKLTFIYIPGPTSLPGDLKTRQLFSFFGQPVPEKLKPFSMQYLNSLENDYKALVLLEITRAANRTEFLIFNNFLAGLSDQFRDYFTEFLKSLKSGRRVIYSTNSIDVTLKISDVLIQYTDEDLPF